MVHCRCRKVCAFGSIQPVKRLEIGGSHDSYNMKMWRELCQLSTMCTLCQKKQLQPCNRSAHTNALDRTKIPSRYFLASHDSKLVTASLEPLPPTAFPPTALLTPTYCQQHVLEHLSHCQRHAADTAPVSVKKCESAPYLADSAPPLLRQLGHRRCLQVS